MWSAAAVPVTRNLVRLQCAKKAGKHLGKRVFCADSEEAGCLCWKVGRVLFLEKFMLFPFNFCHHDLFFTLFFYFTSEDVNQRPRQFRGRSKKKLFSFISRCVDTTKVQNTHTFKGKFTEKDQFVSN